ncbi:alpha/beta-hydrolase [Armillaria novae-zelandiae]|uniref:Alpha/beta-hydrolase n=1 Tax=Armillaria novae-zelandiae TaxID=153914 RepID=A0AA39NVS5_9AGAR|nr:alpha/beta-hydrolase [Armillaria novae-zelandiae]
MPPSCSKDLLVTNFTLQTNTTGTPLWASLKRYTKAKLCSQKIQPGYVLILTHGTGFHKEQWEPTMRHLFNLDVRSTIREAWAVDCQNHGEAAILNERVLIDHPGVLSIYDYVDALVALRRDLLGKSNPDYTERDKFILVGHSAGTVACVLALSSFNPSSITMYDSLILVEPPIHHPSAIVHHTAMFKAISTITKRHDVWASRDEARSWFRKRFPWKAWDPEVLDTYVDHGLRALPTAFYPDKSDGVTLSATWVDENAAYSKDSGSATTALWNLNTLCGVLPVHLIYGARNDLFSREIQDSIVNTAEGRKFASITRVAGAGHWVVQEAPKQMAEALWKILADPIPLHKL